MAPPPVAAFQNRIYILVMSNIVSGRQIRAARMLAGLTQADLARAAGCHPRSVRYWENKGSNPQTSVASTLHSIEQALNRHGVIRSRHQHQASDALVDLNPFAMCRCGANPDIIFGLDHGQPT